MIKALLATATLLAPFQAIGQEMLPPSLPHQLAALVGCWQGKGDVMGKPVTIALNARPIVLGAMLAIETESEAVDDASDRYAAHLLFGAATSAANAPTVRIVGYWADSFGGAFTATGEGQSRPAGFDVTYPYPDADFVNSWQVSGQRMTWDIVARKRNGEPTPFAHYVLEQRACQSSASGK